MRRCGHCDNTESDDASFCTRCGKGITATIKLSPALKRLTIYAFNAMKDDVVPRDDHFLRLYWLVDELGDHAARWTEFIFHCDDYSDKNSRLVVRVYTDGLSIFTRKGGLVIEELGQMEWDSKIAIPRRDMQRVLEFLSAARDVFFEE